MKKKLWITIGILALLGLWAIMYVPYNLEEYNYYYGHAYEASTLSVPLPSCIRTDKIAT